MITRRDLCRMIDHTLLKPWTSEGEIVRLCAEAREYDFAAIAINSCWVPLAARELERTDVKVGATVGFPLGACATPVKACEAAGAVRAGASELDMVINVGWMKSGKFAGVRDDVRAVVDAAREESLRRGSHALVKVIIETCYLDEEEKIRACELVIEAGADFIKTSTGFGPGGATAEDVRLIHRTAAGRALVKAAGGIQTLEQAEAMIEAGASRLGTSKALDIIRQLDARR